ncbi:hypothetical protein, partial [Acetobacter senegalensis]
FASTAVIDYDETVLRWMDHYLRGIDNGVGTAKPVRYFVMGADEWREAAAWPPAARSRQYFLVPGPADAIGTLSTARPGLRNRA